MHYYTRAGGARAALLYGCISVLYGAVSQSISCFAAKHTRREPTTLQCTGTASGRGRLPALLLGSRCCACGVCTRKYLFHDLFRVYAAVERRLLTGRNTQDSSMDSRAPGRRGGAPLVPPCGDFHFDSGWASSMQGISTHIQISCTSTTTRRIRRAACACEHSAKSEEHACDVHNFSCTQHEYCHCRWGRAPSLRVGSAI